MDTASEVDEVLPLTQLWKNVRWPEAIEQRQEKDLISNAVQSLPIQLGCLECKKGYLEPQAWAPFIAATKQFPRFTGTKQWARRFRNRAALSSDHSKEMTLLHGLIRRFLKERYL